MEPDHPVWSRRRLGDRRHRQRAGVRREHGVGIGRVVELGEEAALRLEILDHRLDREVRARGRVGNLSDDLQVEQALGRESRGIRLASLLCPAGQPLPDPFDRPIGRTRCRVVESDAPATLERDLRDARAHRPGADHRDDRALVRALAHRASLSDATRGPRLPCGR